jgi:hypothetical protein
MDMRDDKDLNRFYLSAFPTAQRVEFCEDMAEQRRGVDKIIHFPNGRSVTVDEKKRRKDYGDILLELWSRYEERKPGWLFYSQCDYIVYAVLEARKIYLLPLLLLQTAWTNKKTEWLKLYEMKPAKNKNYTTINIPIPTQELLNTIRAEMEREITCGG